MNKIDSIKAIVLDLDGTLLTPDLKILENTKNILLKAKNNGVKIIIASGRTPQTAVKMTKILEINSPMVLANGALIYNPIDKSIISSNPISRDTINYLLNLSAEIKISLNIYTPHCIYMEEEKIDDYIKDSGDARENLIDQKLYNFNDDIALKCEFFGKDQGYNESLRKLVIDHSKNISEDLYITSAHPNYLEILNKKSNKYFGIKKVLKLESIDEEQALIFGDNHNDIEMLSKFTNTVAMGNAKNNIKEVAKYTTKSNFQDGIFYFIKDMTTILD
ncbi:MAG: Cof-type HAD-IIB family hydrolase [Sphaerochaetaceae bacterium]|nr:Cof-type HAD-IIB family hydrolase [Sphaerochaetaceae bacterium]